jgi:hypothetical protein
VSTCPRSDAPPSAGANGQPATRRWRPEP